MAEYIAVKRGKGKTWLAVGLLTLTGEGDSCIALARDVFAECRISGSDLYFDFASRIMRQKNYVGEAIEFRHITMTHDEAEILWQKHIVRQNKETSERWFPELTDNERYELQLSKAYNEEHAAWIKKYWHEI